MINLFNLFKKKSRMKEALSLDKFESTKKEAISHKKIQEKEDHKLVLLFANQNPSLVNEVKSELKKFSEIENYTCILCGFPLSKQFYMAGGNFKLSDNEYQLPSGALYHKVCYKSYLYNLFNYYGFYYGTPNAASYYAGKGELCHVCGYEQPDVFLTDRVVLHGGWKVGEETLMHLGGVSAHKKCIDNVSKTIEGIEVANLKFPLASKKANAEAVKLLPRSDLFNKWREKVSPALHRNIQDMRKDAESVSLRLDGVIYPFAEFNDVNFRGITSFYSNFAYCVFNNCDFTGAAFSGSDLKAATFNKCKFFASEFVGVDLSFSKFNQCDCGLGPVIFENSNLSGASIQGSFQNCIFDGANLNHATFFKASLDNSKFCKADLYFTQFIECSISDTVFLESRGDKVGIVDCHSTQNSYIDLRHLKIESFFFRNVSKIGKGNLKDFINYCDRVGDVESYRTLFGQLMPQYTNIKNTLKNERLEWDFFICHSHEDKEMLARPLFSKLTALGFKIWYDEFTLFPGEDLREKIFKGISNSSYGIVILSENFFRSKKWTHDELSALYATETRNQRKIIPIWHGIDEECIKKYDPLLISKMGIKSEIGLDGIIVELERLITRKND